MRGKLGLGPYHAPTPGPIIPTIAPPVVTAPTAPAPSSSGKPLSSSGVGLGITPVIMSIPSALIPPPPTPAMPKLAVPLTIVPPSAPPIQPPPFPRKLVTAPPLTLIPAPVLPTVSSNPLPPSQPPMPRPVPPLPQQQPLPHQQSVPHPQALPPHQPPQQQPPSQIPGGWPGMINPNMMMNPDSNPAMQMMRGMGWDPHQGIHQGIPPHLANGFGFPPGGNGMMPPFGMGPGMMPMGMMPGDMGGIDPRYGSSHMMHEDGMRGNRGGFHGQERYSQEEYDYERNNEEEFGPNSRERRQDPMMNDRSGTGHSMREEDRRNFSVMEKDYIKKEGMIDNSERGGDRKRSRSRDRVVKDEPGRDRGDNRNQGVESKRGRTRENDRSEGDNRRQEEDKKRERNPVKSEKDRGRDRDNVEKRRR